MSDILEKICADKRVQVEAAKLLRPFDSLHREALRAPPARGFAHALRDSAERDGVGFITEIKKASPSVGIIRQEFSPASLARAYADWTPSRLVHELDTALQLCSATAAHSSHSSH